MFSGHSRESSGWKWSWHSAARAWHKRKGAINNFYSNNCIFVKQATTYFAIKSKCFNQQHVLQPITSLTDILCNWLHTWLQPTPVLHTWIYFVTNNIKLISQVLLARTYTLAELARTKRQFLVYCKQTPCQDLPKLNTMFVQYINANLTQWPDLFASIFYFFRDVEGDSGTEGDTGTWTGGKDHRLLTGSSAQGGT